MMVNLRELLESSWQVTVIFSAMTGVVCHHVIRPLEIDNWGWTMVFLYLGMLTSVFTGYVACGSFETTAAILRTASVGTAMLAGLSSSILLYRAFFHRLRRFPGPFAARLSSIYHMMVTARTKMQYHLFLQQLHVQHGDFVRTGPRELSVRRASAINLIYGPSSTCGKATWYDQNSGDPDRVGLENVRDLEKHRLRRRAWDRGLGFRALATYEPRVRAKVDLLLSRIGTGNPVDMTQHGIFFGFDALGDIGFSTDFQMLNTGKEHPAIRGLHDAMDVAGLATILPWLMNMLQRIPGATGGFERFVQWCRQQLRDKTHAFVSDEAGDKGKDPQDVISWLIKARVAGDRSAPPTEAAIQEDARLLIIAGSDTVASSFTNILYYLATHPVVYSKLQQLLEAEFPAGDQDWTYEKAKTIPYIDHIIHEAQRLRPAAPMGLPRQTPPQGLQVDEVFIPGNITLSVPAWTIHRHPHYWDRADEFVPERWETLSPDTAPYIAFQRGPYACAGKGLAFMELRMAVSRIALRYKISFPPGESGEDFKKGAKEKLTMWLPPLSLVFTPK